MIRASLRGLSSVCAGRTPQAGRARRLVPSWAAVHRVNGRQISDGPAVDLRWTCRFGADPGVRSNSAVTCAFVSPVTLDSKSWHHYVRLFSSRLFQSES